MSEAVPTPVVLSRKSVASFRLMLLVIVLLSAGYIALKLDSPSFIRITVSDNGQSHNAPFPQPFEVNTNKDGGSKLAVMVKHYLWQNGTFSVELPDACIDRVEIRPEGVRDPIAQPIGDTPLCGVAVFDFSHNLVQGLNEIILTLHSDQPQNTPVYVTPQLFGAHVNSTLACLCIFFALSLVVFKVARLTGLNAASAGILTLGFACYAMLLHLRPDLSYSNDLPGHISYTRHMIDHWMRPFDYEGWEYFHPPVYYFVTSRFFSAFYASGVVSPLSAVRLFALFLYMTFCLYGVRTLYEAIEPRGVSYFVGALLIVFWPIGPTVATRISNDIAVYTTWAVTFYYLSRGYRERSIASLRWAVVFVGVTFLFKSNAVVLGGLVASCILCALLAKRIRLRELFEGKSLLAYGAVALGVLVNVSRVIYTTVFHKPEVIHSYLGEPGSDYYSLPYFLKFDLADFVLHPVVTWQKEPGFMNYFLKSLLYGEQQLGDLHFLPRILDILLVLMLLLSIYGIVSALLRKREHGGDLVPELMGVLIPILATVVFTILKHYVFCQSARYVLPMIIPLVILFVRGVRIMRLPLYTLGIMAGSGIVVGAFVMNVWLYTHGQFT